MGKHFKGDDPLDEVDVRDLPVLVYRPELTSFNDWDDREIPEPLQTVSAMDKLSLAYHEEVTQMVKYIEGVSSEMGFDLPDTQTSAVPPENDVETAWVKAGLLIRRMRALRARMRTVVKHIAKSPNPIAAYDTPEFMHIARYFGEVYEIIFEQKVVYGKLITLFYELSKALTAEDDDDYTLANKLDDYRKYAYMEVARKLKKVRTDARYADKTERDVEDV